MKAILFLIFAHIIADWALQPQHMADQKGKYWFVMAAHCLVWTGCLCFVLEYFNMFAWWKVCMLFIFHWAMDKKKCKEYAARVPFEFNYTKDFIWMYVDQAFHILQCIIVGIL